MRIIRVYRFFSGLRVMMAVIVSGLLSLMWLFLLLVFILFIFSMAFMQGASDFLRTQRAEHDHQLTLKLQYWFPSIHQSLLTLLYAIAGVEPWNPIERALRDISLVYSVLFILCSFFCVFGVLNLVTGVFVVQSTESAKKDRAAMVEQELEQKSHVFENLGIIFEEADVDCSGSISWEEFNETLKTPEVQAYLSSLELRVDEAEELFMLLDSDGEGSISIDEFLHGILRLKGNARALDQLMLMDRIDKVHAMLHGVLRALNLSKSQRGAEDSSAMHRRRSRMTSLYKSSMTSKKASHAASLPKASQVQRGLSFI